MLYNKYYHQNNSGGEANPTSGQPAGNEKLLAGKYKTQEELEAGYLHQMAETNKIIERERATTQRLNALIPLLETQGSDRQMPADRAAARGSRLDEVAGAMNIPAEQLTGAIADIVAAQLAPITQGITARQTVMSEIPDFAKYEVEVAQFLEANPEKKQAFTEVLRVRPDVALKAAYYDYRASAANSAGGNPTTRVSASGLTQEQARIDAGLAGGATGRENENAGIREQKLTVLEANAHKSGNWTEYLAEFLQGGGHVSPEHLTKGTF